MSVSHLILSIFGRFSGMLLESRARFSDSPGGIKRVCRWILILLRLLGFLSPSGGIDRYVNWEIRNNS